MNKLGAILIALLVVTVAFTGCITSDSSPKGFDLDSISAPVIVSAQAVNVTMPSPMTAVSPSYGISLGWTITEDIYAGHGGVLRLTVKNTNPSGQIYVYGFGLKWDSGLTTSRNCSVYIPHGQQADVGLLAFDAPTEPGNHSYGLLVSLASSNALVTAWHDHGAVPQDSAQSVEVQPLGEDHDYVVERNVDAYYDRINARVSYDAASGAADSVTAEQPGAYNILQVAEAYEWMRENIEYKLDGSVDHWQDAAETLSLGTGDCEDHAILMASIIGALGGYARVNIIDAHAFPTVFVGTTSQEMAQVEAALASYYGLGPSELEVSYLHDEIGYWLVIDTTGFPYAGGIPAQSAPTSASGDWSIQSDYLYPIDATGETTGSLFDLF